MSEILTVRLPYGCKETLEKYGKKEVIISLAEGLESGDLNFNGSITGRLDTRDFEKACKRNNEDPVRILKMVTEQLWSN